MSLNDPQWGKRGRTGPPDLDEIWRNVNRRFNDLFGRKQPADSGDDAAPPKRPLPLGGAGLLAALVLVVWLVSCSYFVD
jgi:membrane protease subunit HflK